MDATDKVKLDYMADRSALHFAEEVKGRFSYLAAFNFTCVLSDPTLVRFQSPSLIINVYHGRKSYEINLELSSVEPQSNVYSFYEILRLVSPDRALKYRNYASQTRQGVVEGVENLATLFRACMASGVVGSEIFFAALEAQKMKLADDLSLESRLLNARRVMDEAWRSKDYGTVVRTLSPLTSSLSKVEFARLKFAQKKLKKEL